MSNVNNAIAVGDSGLNSQTATPPVASVTPPAASEPAAATPATKSVAQVSQPVADIENAADFRLVIEEDQATGSYIYKTLDRRTGEVIQQFPREQVLKFKDSEDYNAGSLVSARV